VKIRVGLKGSDRFAQCWRGAERNLLPAPSGPLDKPRRWQDAWQ